ncbi:Transcriptional regulator YqjI [compost metagenome]
MTDTWQPEERLFLHHLNEREVSGSGRRYFSRGGVKYALLELLQQENMHGYQMMKALEDQSGGTYKPSAGSIYPTLQMLRDQGLVQAFKQDGKKVFEITDDGKVYLRNELETGGDGNERREPGFIEEEGGSHDHHKPKRRLTPAGKELLHLLRAAERTALQDAARAVQLREILANLRQALGGLIDESAAAVRKAESNE